MTAYTFKALLVCGHEYHSNRLFYRPTVDCGDWMTCSQCERSGYVNTEREIVSVDIVESGK
jgi:hypothetical protein